jgi:hypothetical protein
VQRQGFDYVRLDGSTPQKLRQGICDEFNSRPSIFMFLMSTVAGGLGLNLTAANKVVRLIAFKAYAKVSLVCSLMLAALNHPLLVTLLHRVVLRTTKRIREW